MTNRIQSRCSRVRGDPLCITLFAAFVLACEGCGTSQTDGAVTSQRETVQDTAAASHASLRIDSAGFATRIGFLASDQLRGRATPSPGLTMAAEYIAREFASMGLQPGGEQGSFLQWYNVETDRGEQRAPNVVAILRGNNPELRDTYVVYSAHMDHVGVGPPDARGDSIYNGADDDASGTTAVIEIAEAFASLPTPPARSVAFVAVSGEEVGLFGSRAFVEAGPLAREAMVANINIDMIGRNSRDTLAAIGLTYSTLGARAIQVARTYPELQLAVVDDLWPDERFFFRSDHYNFARAGIPAVFFFSGVHEDYHRPSDEPSKIDNEKAARIARLAFRLGLEVAQNAQAPTWTSEGRAALKTAGR